MCMSACLLYVYVLYTYSQIVHVRNFPTKTDLTQKLASSCGIIQSIHTVLTIIIILQSGFMVLF